MLIFIIPLRSRAVSNDWQRVSELCARTVASCCRQTAGESRTILVCSEAPSLPPGLRNLTIIEDAFPCPENKDAQGIDKCLKIQRGLIHARSLAPFFLMKVDSDDCVSNRLAGFVALHPHCPGWLFDKGWVHEENTQTAYLSRRGFFRMCGTSSILACRKKEALPISMAQPMAQFPLVHTWHNQLDKLSLDKGESFSRLPFPGAVYCAGTGENWSDFKGVRHFTSKSWTLRRWLHTRLITRSFREEFGLTPLSSSSRPSLQFTSA